MVERSDIETLIVTDGGLPSMVAAMGISRPDRAAFWTMPLGAGAMDCTDLTMTAGRQAAAETQARALGFHSCLAAPVLKWPSTEGRAPTGVLLLLAIECARERGISKVLWPIAAGENPAMLLEASETSHLIGRLAALKLSGSTASRWTTATLVTPLIDLNAEQVAELALDLDVPLELVWWRQGGAMLGPDTAKARWIWDQALRTAAANLEFPLPSS